MRRDWNSKELKQEIVLPVFVVMHEGFSWSLFCLKFSAFSSDLKSVDMKLDNFELISFSDITAINIYKDSHAKPVSIRNVLSFTGKNAVCSTREPGNFGHGEKKGIGLNFSIQFPDLEDTEPYEVLIYFEINDFLEYVLAENILDGAYHESDNPYKKVITPSTKELFQNSNLLI